MGALRYLLLEVVKAAVCYLSVRKRFFRGQDHRINCGQGPICANNEKTMADTTKKILRLLHPDQPLDVRCAAVVVLGEIGGKDAELTRVLCDALKDEEARLRLQVIQAVGKLRIEAALPYLLDRVKEGGERNAGVARIDAESCSRLASPHCCGIGGGRYGQRRDGSSSCFARP